MLAHCVRFQVGVHVQTSAQVRCCSMIISWSSGSSKMTLSHGLDTPHDSRVQNMTGTRMCCAVRARVSTCDYSISGRIDNDCSDRRPSRRLCLASLTLRQSQVAARIQLFCRGQRRQWLLKQVCTWPDKLITLVLLLGAGGFTGNLETDVTEPSIKGDGRDSSNLFDSFTFTSITSTIRLPTLS
jgi:hypothetical protein